MTFAALRRFVAPMASAAILVVACASLVAPSLAQAPVATTCRSCGNHGVIDCSKHKKGMLETERKVAFCSAAESCKACSGALSVDCKQCTNETAQSELAKRVETVRAWREALRGKVDAHSKVEPMLHLQTAHCDLSFGVPKLTVGKDKLDTHEAMHLYGDRIEALRALFLETLHCEDKEFSARLLVYMCRDSRQANDLGPRVTGLGGNFAVGTKLMGLDAVYCMWQEPRGLPDDEALHRNIVHNVVHLLTANLQPAGYFGNPANGWVDEGLAHWFEDKIGGKCTNYCFEEVLTQQGQTYKGGRWRPAVRLLLDTGGMQSLAAIGPKNTDQLTFPEHAQSFAMVDCLLTKHGGEKFKAFLKQLKAKVEMRDAMQAVYGFGPLAFDKEFQEWVAANYSSVDSPR
ncbi:MAG: Peptidase superfamily [Planctomycetota bacterium]|jgi:hypothetical protein